MLPIWKNKVISVVFSKPYLYRLFIYYKNWFSIFFKKYDPQIRDIVVCGIQRSGSTLLFNIIQDILIENMHSLDTLNPYFEDECGYKDLLNLERSVFIKKNHVFVPLLAKRIKSGYSIGFFTHRDIRDVIVSQMQIGWINSLDEWIKNHKIKNIMNNALLYAKTPKIHVFSYTSLMHNRLAVIDEIAKILKIKLSEESRLKILEKSSIKSINEKIEMTVGESGKNTHNQLMRNHIANGEIGKWRYWFSEEEKAFLNKYCEPYLRYFAYEN